MIFMVFVSLFSGFLPISKLGHMTSIGTLLAFVIVCIGIIWMRKTNPNAPRPYRTPLVPLVPILGVLVCFAMMVSLDCRDLDPAGDLAGDRPGDLLHLRREAQPPAQGAAGQALGQSCAQRMLRLLASAPAACCLRGGCARAAVAKPFADGGAHPGAPAPEGANSARPPRETRRWARCSCPPGMKASKRRPAPVFLSWRHVAAGSCRRSEQSGGGQRASRRGIRHLRASVRRSGALPRPVEGGRNQSGRAVRPRHAGRLERRLRRHPADSASSGFLCARGCRADDRRHPHRLRGWQTRPAGIENRRRELWRSGSNSRATPSPGASAPS